MTERQRLIRQRRPETRQALALARRLTRHEPLVKRVSRLTGDVRGELMQPAPDKPYEIRFLRGQEPILDHIITHEVGHLTRLYAVPEAERLFPVSTTETRRRALDQLRPELTTLLALGGSPETLAALFDRWVQEIGTMLANFPADLRIERWIAERFPGLRLVQERALEQTVWRGLPLLGVPARVGTPPTVYRAKMAMNAAEALHAAELLERPALFGPYRRHGFEDVAGDLMHRVFEDADEGHRSDMQAATAWAQVLGVTGWVTWQPYQPTLPTL